MTTIRTLLFSLFTITLVGACGGGTPKDPELDCTGATSVTLSGELQSQVIDVKCKSCHVANYQYGDYTDATKTAAATVNKKSLYAGMTGKLMIVEANKLENSSLWLKVLGGDAANRKGPNGEGTLGKMPNDGTELTAAQKKLLKDWICTGAK